MNTNTQKNLAATLSIFSNIFIIILKILAGIASGSISIISEAIHSLGDLTASFLTFFSVLKSSKPADEKHPFGHGKFEDLSGFLEGILIILAAIFIIFEASKKLLNTHLINIDTNIGLVVMGISAILNFIVSSILLKVAQKTDSISLNADAQHLRTDVLSSLGIFIGLLIIKITGIYLLDPLIAIFIAMIILKVGLKITHQTTDNLLDCSLPEKELKEISNFLDKFKGIHFIEYKNLKARRLGPQKRIEVTLLFQQEITLLDCHKACDIIENNMKENFKNISITIHCEPIEK